MKRQFSVRTPVPLLAGLTLLLAFDGTGLARLSLGCALLHEAGHVLAFWLLTRRLPRLSASFTGLALQLDGTALPPARENLLLLAGPTANLLAAGIALLLALHRAAYGRYFFAAENLCMAFFNLLPIGFLDGGRLLANCLGPQNQRFARAAGLLCCALLAAAAALLLQKSGFRGADALFFCLLVLVLCARVLRE